MKNLKTVTPSDFYLKLSKKDKSKFLAYMHVKYGLKTTTLVHKLSKKSNDALTLLEEYVLSEEIKKIYGENRILHNTGRSCVL